MDDWLTLSGCVAVQWTCGAGLDLDFWMLILYADTARFRPQFAWQVKAAKPPRAPNIRAGYPEDFISKPELG